MGERLWRGSRKAFLGHPAYWNREHDPQSGAGLSWNRLEDEGRGQNVITRASLSNTLWVPFSCNPTLSCETLEAELMAVHTFHLTRTSPSKYQVECWAQDTPLNPSRIAWDLNRQLGFPCGSAGKESTCNVGDLGSIPGLGRSQGERKGYPLQYSGLENSTDCIVHGVAKSWIWLSDFHFHWRGGQGLLPLPAAVTDGLSCSRHQDSLCNRSQEFKWDYVALMWIEEVVKMPLIGTLLDG